LYQSLPGWLGAWSFQPAVLADLALAGALYAVGWSRLGRRAEGRARPAVWRAACYAAGIGVLALALFSPLDTFDGRYFVVHMLQHLLLTWAAPPLLWLGAPLVPLLWGLPANARRQLGRRLRPGRLLARLGNALVSPLVSLPIFLVVVATWHVPALYNLAEGRTLLHDLEHLSFLGAGLLYWWPIVQPTPGRRLAPLGGGLFYLLVPAMEGGLLGGYFTFAERVVYSYYLRPASPGALSPLADQQLAGIAMWLLGGLIDAAAAFTLIGGFLLREEREAAGYPGEVPSG
jgi:cytochrome c oxidase assembly factor CtaG